MADLKIYKQGQGKYTRLLTLLGVMLITLIGAVVLSEKLSAYTPTEKPLIRFGIPTAVFIAIGVLMAYLLNRPGTADFMIATEGEMKKVSWSSRKEIVGSTKVVIVTTVILAVILFGVDLLFVFLFRWWGVMGSAGS